MAFRKFQGQGFTLIIEGPAGADGRKRETTYVSCRRQDFDDVLASILSVRLNVLSEPFEGLDRSVKTSSEAGSMSLCFGGYAVHAAVQAFEG